MANGITRDQLTEPARAVARVVAASRIDVARSALDQLDTESPNGLHDLRVALRRLRSWMRTYRRELDDTVRKKTRRRIDKLARATDHARDAEVMSAWLARQHDLPPRARRGAAFLTTRIAAEFDDASGQARDTLAARLPDTLDALDRQLSHYWRRIAIERQRNEQTMASATADLVRQQYRRFRRRLGRIESGDDDAVMHRARIAAKRLRYLLECLRDFSGIAVACEQLSELQDLLGRCHDDHVLIARVFDEIGTVGAADAVRRAKLALELPPDDETSPVLARVRPGLVEIASRAGRERDETFQRCQQLWPPATVDAMTRVIDGLIGELESI
jgi:CHAD domain-containing protein